MRPHGPHMRMRSAAALRTAMQSSHAVLSMRPHMRSEYAAMRNKKMHMRIKMRPCGPNMRPCSPPMRISSHRWISNFQSGLINSKKIQKNIKFGLQAHINMENKMNGSDRHFGFWNFKFGPYAYKCTLVTHSLSLYIYIYVDFYFKIRIYKSAWKSAYASAYRICGMQWPSACMNKTAF